MITFNNNKNKKSTKNTNKIQIQPTPLFHGLHPSFNGSIYSTLVKKTVPENISQIRPLTKGHDESCI